MKHIENKSVGVGTVRPLITEGDLMAAGRFGCAVWSIPGRLTVFMAWIEDDGVEVVACGVEHVDWDYKPAGWRSRGVVETCGNCREGIHTIACRFECGCGCHALAVRDAIEDLGPRFVAEPEPVARVSAYTAEDIGVMVSIFVVIVLWLFAAYRG